MKKSLIYIDKSAHPYRWILLSISIWINLGAWYCFDHPAALHNTFKEYFSNIDPNVFEIYFSGLYSVYSFANIFLPFISGRCRDTLGDRFVLLLMCFLITLGQSIFVWGIYNKSFFVMYIGRITLGWGIESVLPAQNSFISPYFEKDYLSFAFGLIGLFATFGSVLCMWLLPVLADRYGLIWAVSSGIILNAFSLLCALTSTFLDRKFETRMLEESQQYQNVQNNDVIEPIIPEGSRRSFLQEAFAVEMIFSQSKIFWYLSIFYGFVYASILSFTNVSIGLLSERWLADDPQQEIVAGRMVGVVWLISGLSTPVLGYFIDIYGSRGIINILAALMLICSQYLIWYFDPFLGMVTLGITYSLTFATVWSSLVYVVRPEFYGRAFATVVSTYNLLFTISPLIVGYLRSSSGSYELCQQYLVVISCIALIFAILIFIEDNKLNNIIDGKNQVQLVEDPNFYLRSNPAVVYRKPEEQADQPAIVVPENQINQIN